jgi:16S rRNA (guanine966-N2)-methyltransferase
MRIIGGKAKGTKLYTLEGENTRPTLDRVRESLFNILQYRLQDSVFLDLFSGSGACRNRSSKPRCKKSHFM